MSRHGEKEDVCHRGFHLVSGGAARQCRARRRAMSREPRKTVRRLTFVDVPFWMGQWRWRGFSDRTREKSKASKRRVAQT